ALGAGRGDVQWIDGREWIAGGANAVDTVTTDAGGDPLFTLLFQQPAVDAGVVFALLIDSQRGIESLHQVRVAVTLATVRRDIQGLRLAKITFAWILGSFLRLSIGIAAMAIVAGQSASVMDVIIEELRRRAQTWIIELQVA